MKRRKGRRKNGRKENQGQGRRNQELGEMCM